MHTPVVPPPAVSDLESLHLMDVLAHPNPTLKQRAAEVDPTSDDSLRDLVVSMAKAMYQAPGIGLAATQVGVLKRVVVYDLDDEGGGLTVLCNPRILSYGEESELDDEGCLSFPGIAVPVERATSVVCEAQSLNGETVTFDAAGLHARLLQHEIDHLDGVLIIDRATPDERRAAMRRYREALDQGAVPGQTSI
jgi:peptide deformylase